MERSHARAGFAEGLQPVERTHDGATVRSCYRLTAMPVFHFAVLPWTRGDREIGSSKCEVESEQRGQQEGNVLF